MSIKATKAMMRDVVRPIAMPSDYCTSNSDNPYGNDDVLKRMLKSVITENIITIGLMVVVILVTAFIVQYVVRVLMSIIKEYRDHTTVIDKLNKSKQDAFVNAEDADEDREDEVYKEPPKLPKVPQVFSVKKRIAEIEKQYKTYNETISKRRDGSQAIMDSRIMAREHDNYTYRKGKPQPTVRV